MLDRVAAPEPTPGGGTVAAIAGAFGVALAQMVAGLPRTRHEHATRSAPVLATLQAPLADLRERLLALADEDAAAFDRLMAAFRLPKGTDEEKAARRAAVAGGDARRDDRAAADRGGVRPALEAIVTVAALGNPSASSDLLVAMGAAAGRRPRAPPPTSATNLEGLDDETFRSDASTRHRRRARRGDDPAPTPPPPRCRARGA